MIRSVVAFFLFAVFVCAAIIIRSGQGEVAARSTPLVSPSAASAAAPPAPQQAPVAEVTRAEIMPMALPASASRIAVPQGSQIQTEPAIRTDTALTMEDMTNNVLAELGLLPESATTLPQQAQQRETTASIIAGIGAATGRDTGMADREDLQSLVVAALREGQDDNYIDSLVNAAAADGRVAVPEILVTSDGRVDTSVLLSNIVVQARAAAGQPSPPIRPQGIADAQGIEVRLVQAASGTTEARFYTVQRGDSLGAIAIKFYGNVNEYPRIFAANRQTLSSPDRIRTGQRLVIPDL